MKGEALINPFLWGWDLGGVLGGVGGVVVEDGRKGMSRGVEIGRRETKTDST